MLNMQWLKTFCQLVETHHFTRTAEQLFMTQSGVSQHIQKLEQQCEQKLLIREGKTFYLTDAGQRLYDQGLVLLQQAEQLSEVIKQDEPYKGKVKIKTPGSVGLKLYGHLLKLQQAHPELTIDLRFAPNEEIISDTNEGKIDLGIVTQQVTQAGITSQYIGAERLVLVTPKDMTIRGWPSLQSCGFINHPDGAHHASLLLSQNYSEFKSIDQFRESGFSNQITLILEPVAAGLGITVLPEYAVDTYMKNNKNSNIKAISLPVDVTESLYLVTKNNKPTAARCETVVNEIKRWL
ncbi:LysR family transcriptional regulator [Psychrosphaera ytuae]|uniref:LysR family transcriptional regulator n=1 Tax=Psychrosphaera ytuae TaxID=2820710 RepID=A0A975DBJ0_9GAMM|nr:LysR family transcriptional regulator [Psychrosphaera ytuae]QTH63281.1 LysR family transcriptional regulator [Psychrosphaera ytuae]